METKVHVEELRAVVGEEHVREATAADAVDGVEPSFVVEPGSVEEISAVMALASRERLAVLPRGGGTKIGWGNPPSSLDLILSLARMNSVIEHVPGDQIVRVQAGLRLGELQERLSGAGQMLAIDPPEKGATVGGIVAANSSGPRRYRYGTIRDLIIGIRVVLADGTIAKAGGKVVKNVAGYDLSKLFVGSMGTLGVIAEANFRLHPVPESARMLAVDLQSTQDAWGAAQAVMHSQVEATAVELRWSEAERRLYVVVESIPEGVEAKVEAVSFLLKPFGEVRTLADGDPAPLAVREGEVSVKITAPPSELTAALDAVLGSAERRGIEVRVAGHAASGVTVAGLSGGEDALADVIREVREIVVRKGGAVVVHDAPASLKRKVGVWGPAGDYLALLRRVKDKFDPPGLMSPGRFIGGI